MSACVSVTDELPTHESMCVNLLLSRCVPQLVCVLQYILNIFSESNTHTQSVHSPSCLSVYRFNHLFITFK